MDKNLCEKLAKKTEEMYRMLEYEQEKNYHSRLRDIMQKNANSVRDVKKIYGDCECGKLLKDQLRKITMLEEEYKSFTEHEVPIDMAEVKAFEKKSQQMRDENVAQLQEIIEKYDTITGKIEGVAAGKCDRFKQERSKIEKQFLSDYYNNLKANAEFIQNMDHISEQELQHFFKTKIIINNELQKQLKQLYEKALQELVEEFELLQKECVVSDYHAGKYVFRAGIDVERVCHVPELLPEKIMGSEFGIRKKISGLLNRMMRTPMERARKIVDDIVSDIVSHYEIADVVCEYMKFCERIRDDSMKEICASRDKTNLLCEQLKAKKLVTEEQQIEQMGLQEILMQ